MKKTSTKKRKEYQVWVKIHFRGGEREPTNESYEVKAYSKSEAKEKAKKRLLKMCIFEAQDYVP